MRGNKKRQTSQLKYVNIKHFKILNYHIITIITKLREYKKCNFSKNKINYIILIASDKCDVEFFYYIILFYIIVFHLFALTYIYFMKVLDPRESRSMAVVGGK